MSDGLSFEVEDRISPKLADAPRAVRLGLQDVGSALAADLLDRVRAKAGGEVLQVRSRRLLDSIEARVAVGANGIVARVSSDAPQALILEYGGEIPAHEIVPVDAKALRFAGSAGAVWAAVTKMPDVEIPAHSYLRSALEEMRDEIETVMIDEVDLALAVALA